MDFINKLIKKGIFGLIVIVSFFIFTNGIEVKAEECKPVLNDGDKYLVLNTTSAWRDSGVTITCNAVQKENVYVQVNSQAPAQSINGVGVADSYVTTPGFYKVKYYITDAEGTELSSITRQIRVLPYDLNDVRNIWVGETEKINTIANDVFNKIININLADGKRGYLAVGSFGSKGYIVAFNARGEYLWDEIFGNEQGVSDFQIADIIVASENDRIYYLSGQYTNEDEETVAFVKSIQLNNPENGGVNNLYGTTKDLYDQTEQIVMMTKANKMVFSSNYLFVVGYKINEKETKTGVIVRIEVGDDLSLGSITYKPNSLDSEYNSVISIVENSTSKIIAVGSTFVAGYTGATGGNITICESESFDCEHKTPYLYLNDNLASTTITTFSDIVSHGTNYVVVGQSRIDKVNGKTTSINAGAEDALFVLLDNNFSVLDVQLRGSSSTDNLKTIKQIDGNSLLTAGNRAGVGYYVTITINEDSLGLVENAISGNLGVEFNDVFIQKSNNKEMQFVFVGSSRATSIEGIMVENKGESDTVLVLLDMTQFSNYENINIKKDTVVCLDGASYECSGNLAAKEYWLIYGNKEIAFPSQVIISSLNAGQISTYHDFINEDGDSEQGFINEQGIKFKIGRIIYITENPVAPDIELGEMGIDKWYLYSRPQVVGNNVAGLNRETLWSEYYYPVENNIEKKGEDYYVLTSSGVFVPDDSNRNYTFNNYIKMANEPQNTTVAFQSTAKVTAKDTGFAILQEFTRIAVVNKKYNSITSGITAFQGEVASLATQNYYFVYYIDLKFDNKSTCGTTNNELSGNCTNFTGYAFASLERIKVIANLIVEKYNHFVSESNSQFNSKGTVSLPSETGGYREQMTTNIYTKKLSVPVNNNELYLIIDHRPVVNGVLSNTVNSSYITNINRNVVFGYGGDKTEDGEYTVKYCYNYRLTNEHCGTSATFVIDTTAPIINYKLDVGDEGVVIWPVDPSDPTKLKGNLIVKYITDIDPFAYTIVDGKKYYLSCDAMPNNGNCSPDQLAYVIKEYVYDATNPSKVYDIHVYDRAGNKIDFYFMIGSAMPTVNVVNDPSGESFSVRIDFYNKNDIDSLAISYTPSEACPSENACADAYKLQNLIMNYINALIYNNTLEELKVEADPTYIPDIDEYIELIFTVSLPQADGSISGGVRIPEITYNSDTGVYTIGEELLYPISKGLYQFVLADKFQNIDSENYAGLGLSKAELETYIEVDETYTESKDLFVGDLQGVRIPKTKEEAGDIYDINSIFIAQTPSTYLYTDYLPSESLKNSLNQTMFFTDQFIYIKFKANQFGILQINRATKLNNVGNFIIDNNYNLECLINIYGESVDSNKLTTCGNSVLFGNISSAKDYLATLGIYFVGALDEYYYLAFTNDGTYSITSSVYAKLTVTENEQEKESVVALPVTTVFTIDTQSPEISFDFVCLKGRNCKGENNVYTKEDFVYEDKNTTKVNIGNYYMRLKFNQEYLYNDGISVEDNRLMMIKINGELYNAYDVPEIYKVVVDTQVGTIYDIDTTDDIEYEGNLDKSQYILFRNSGVYEIIIFDAAGNEITYRFIIDEQEPQVSISDPSGIGYTEYRQYVEAKITVSENSFLTNKNNEAIITITYSIEGGTEETITVVYQENNCKIALGSGLIKQGSEECNLIDNNGSNSITLSFVIEINKEERNSDTRSLNVTVKDYFGNIATKTQGFEFDNHPPYIYYDSQYEPIKVFGENVSNIDRQKMLSTNADNHLGDFICANPDLSRFNLYGVIICRDTPDKQTKNNNVTVKAYEAYRAANNNYKYEDGKYVYMEDGVEYIDINDVVYKKNYAQFSSASVLEEDINSGKKIYKKSPYVQVKENDLIDPNITYYYKDESGNITSSTTVTLKNMYTDSDFASYTKMNECANEECKLYRMYIDYGYFTTGNTGFYKYNDEVYTEITSEEKNTIISGNYQNFAIYYYETGFSVDNDYSDNYLKAVTQENACVKVNNNICTSIGANRIKLQNFGTNIFTYYIVINRATISGNPASVNGGSQNQTSYLDSINVDGTTKTVIIDDSIWRIAIDKDPITRETFEVEFGFGLASNLGRPIIFRSIDGAGNIGANQLETVMIIKDSDAPYVENVSSVKYEKIENVEDVTINDYAKVTNYYKVYDIASISCDLTNSIYYSYNSTDGIYEPLTCGDFEGVSQVYVGVDVYEKYDPTKTYPQSTNYYKATIEDLKSNYLTKENIIISFNEPIYKVECTYYLYDANTNESITRQCDIYNTEFDYREKKTTFGLVYEEAGRTNYFVNYELTVYDFSGNPKRVISLFIDRENPVINFSGEGKEETRLEVNYIDGNIDSNYNFAYTETGFASDTYSVDKVNNRINEIGASLVVDNSFSYEVVYYKYNYNKTYKNYVKLGDSFEPYDQGDGKDKGTGDFYILIKKPEDYVLKGLGAECKETDEYCYIKDSHSYYPELLMDSRFWTQLGTGESIKVGEISVYKIEYRVKDKSGNISETIVKTIYVQDTQKPQLKLNGETSDQKYGYHNHVTVSFENEKEAMYYRYSCKDSILTCALPQQIFPTIDGTLSETKKAPTDGKVEETFNEIEGIYKIYFHDLGRYVETTLNDGTKIMTLKYNYNEYQFVIDMTPPEFYVTARQEGPNNTLYYEVSLENQEANLYCVTGGRNDENVSFGNTLDSCEGKLSGTPKNEESADGTKFTYSIYNSKNQLIYEKIYKKLEPYAAKYFHNTYYHKEGNSFVQYQIGASYAEDNVYIVSSIKLYFREDGQYLIKSIDKAGNVSGRTINGNGDYESPHSGFIVDNTAPSYNKQQQSPTGVNYWYSVPSVVISNKNIDSMKNITKENDAYYKIFSSGLNSNFFYAFATKTEAIEYLTSIYTTHINAQTGSNCETNNIGGFKYDYYDPTTKMMKSTPCFIDDNEKTAKVKVIDEISEIFSQMTFATFSGSALFGNSEIKQLACDSELSSNCINNKDMYKYIYLKYENGNPTIEETCSESATVTCIKVNVKIIQNVDNSNYMEFKLGADNVIDPDSTSVTVYYRPLKGGTDELENSPFTQSKTIALSNQTYYVFVEKDQTIDYPNYTGTPSSVTHVNTTYYAIYVDNDDHLDVYYEDDGGKHLSNRINSDGEGSDTTNDDVYYLILSRVDKDGNIDSDFNLRYDIHELRDGSGNIIEVYSYLRLMIGDDYYNINDYIEEKHSENYYFRIPLVNVKNDPNGGKIDVYLQDRAGNTTHYFLSHSQKAPDINIYWSQDYQNIEIQIIENSITRLDKDSVKVYFKDGKEGSSYVEAINIRNALVCEDNTTGYTSKCYNAGTRNNYELTLTNIEELFGFFKIEIADDHENTNSINFIYNPTDLTVNYTTSNVKYIGYVEDSENVRMISNSELKIEWDNKWNYIVLYKVNDGVLEEVCNSLNMGITGNYLCKNDNNLNYVETITVDTTYSKSILHYLDEGLYEVRVVNRESVIINQACYENGEVLEDCKPIKTYSSVVCSWDNNPEQCAKGLQIVTQTVQHQYDGQVYTRFEIDKTKPNIQISDFVVDLPTGSVEFENNAVYTNAEVKVKWNETFTQLVYKCEYTDPTATENCPGNSTGYNVENKEYVFKVANRLSTKYTFWFEDYAGNSTEDNKLSFTINIALPEFNVYELNNEGMLLENKQVLADSKINNNAKLLCYVDGINTNCNVYDVKLYRYSINGYQLVTSNDVTTVSDNFENQYKFVVSIKNAITGYVYQNLNKEFVFTIDKVAPNITVEGDNNNLWGIYKGDVRVLIDSSGIGTIYSDCVVTGEDDVGDKTYDCSNVLVEEFTSNYTLKDTGIYKIIAEDDIGNITEGKLIKYITIDNTNPEISILAQTTYLNYELSENGYTNAQKVVIQSLDKNKDNDNSQQSYIMYRMKNANGTYTEWVTHSANVLEITEEGFYEVKPVDLVGNQGIERHFIIYRQQPKYSVYVGNNATPNTLNDIITEDALISWNEPTNELEAPLVKVTVNGKPYTKREKITETGEYIFVFVDLAGNTATHKITINKNENICLNNVNIKPNKQFLFPVEEIKFSGGKGYEFKENDVIILATPTNYYGGSSACGENIFSYKTLTNDKTTYLVINKNTAKYINENENVTLTLSDEARSIIEELGGYVYVFVVDKSVAKNDLGFEIGENFFTKDPLGWSLIIIAGLGLIYLGFKVFVFKKKVKVLK